MNRFEPGYVPPTLRRLVWAYFWLLIFEGALRKWLVPGLSSALLIVRDPIVVAIYAISFQRRLVPPSLFLASTVLLGVLSFAASFAGDGNLGVTLYGLHANFLHLPLIVILPCILRLEEILKMSVALLYTLPLMTVLAVLQFKGGPDSHWNVGAGGEVGGQLYAAQGKVRASGTFSFATGFATYLALCCTVLLDSLLARRGYARWLTFLGVPCVVLSLVVSGSRTAVISVGIVCIMAIVISVVNSQRFGAALRPLIFSIIAAAAISVSTPLFREGIAVHEERFVGGGGVKEGLLYRYAEEFTSALHAIYFAPALGHGLGIGTNAGAAMLHGQRNFLLGEHEWERIILESGPFLGTACILLRCGAVVMVVVASFRALRKDVVLPLLLFGVTGIDLFTGQFGQPTALGFAVFTAGLALAAANSAHESSSSESKPDLQDPPPLAQGRSSYAQRLHGES